jgi:hypothetical protein
LVLVDRDYEIFREVERWRFCLGRHIKVLAGFSGQRACDRRLKVLIKAGFLERSKIIYGMPSVYSLTHKAKMLIGANKRQDKIRLDNIAHDIAVIDTAIYFITKLDIPLKSIITEKQLHSKNGFGVRSHQPDFIFTKDDKTYCVEVELSLKSKARLENNIKSNFLVFDIQIWVVGEITPKLIYLLEEFKIQYTNIKILNIKEIKKWNEQI